MFKRHHQILAAILVVQIALSVFVFWPTSSAVAEQEPLFPDVQADDITALTIENAEGASIQLVQETGDWVLPEADDYPANGSKVTSFLEKVVGLQTGQVVASSEASHKRLQVSPDDFVGYVAFETSDGAEYALYLGSSPRYGAMHFRLEGQDEAYLTNDLTTYDANPDVASWIDTTYVSVPQQEVVKVALENANGEFVFEKGDEGTWTMEGLAADETLDATKIAGVLRQVAALRMTEPLGKEELSDYGLDEPSAIATIETMTDTVTINVGAKAPEGGGYVVSASTSPYYVRVAEANVKALVENGREAFLKQPPTPTPEAQ
jgi:hypothetical protein